MLVACGYCSRRQATPTRSFAGAVWWYPGIVWPRAVLLVLAGCGRLGFEARDLEAGDAAADAVPVVGFSRLIAGDQTTCGIYRDRAYCWGRGTQGEIGDGQDVDRAVPTEVALPAGTVSEVTQGEGHGCAIVDAKAYCWGATAIGNIAGSTVVAPTAPTLVAGLATPVTAIAAGGGFACAVAGGRVACWGDDSAGRLGNGPLPASATPVAAVLPDLDAVAVDAGNDHACALLVDDSVWCWGHNDGGALGFGALVPDVLETPVQTLVTGVLPAIAGWHACASIGGAARCWGTGERGELGDNGFASSPTPVGVSGMGANVTVVATGGGPDDFDASCAAVSGALACWGSGTFGRLGDGATVDRGAPVEVAGLAPDIVEAALGYDHTCARHADGNVDCWGRGELGQLGDGNSASSVTPVRVPLPN